METTFSSTTAALQRLTHTGRARIVLVIIGGVLVGSLAFLYLTQSPARPPTNAAVVAGPIVTYPTWSAHYQALKDRWYNPGGKANFNNVLVAGQ